MSDKQCCRGCSKGCGGPSRSNSGDVNGFCHTFTGGVVPHEGRVITSPVVFPIFWGSTYSARDNNGVLNWRHPGAAAMRDFVNDLIFGNWLAGLSQYGVGRGHATVDEPAGCFDPVIPSLAPNQDVNSVDEASIRQFLVKHLDSSGIGNPSTNELRHCFLIFLPTTAVLSDAPLACGYHKHGKYQKSDGDDNLFFAVIATKGQFDSNARADFCRSGELLRQPRVGRDVHQP
jgi:hypothetical protein